MKSLITVALVLLISRAGFAQNEVFIKSNEAIQGYDPVAYFKESKPVKGNAGFVYSWKNAVWHFSSEQNLADFKANPEKFAPQFGGYCAYGMAEGHKAPTSPDAWTILDNKLYLNYNLSVRDLWNKDIPGNIKKANDNWPAVKKDKD